MADLFNEAGWMVKADHICVLCKPKAMTIKQFLSAFVFWLGGVVSFFVTVDFINSLLLFNARLYFLLGASLVYFLVHKLHVLVRQP
jgi:cytosine/uracil/thiamine/allantoin permease